MAEPSENGVYDPPRELIGALPEVTLTEMPRHSNLSFCCGGGGAGKILKKIQAWLSIRRQGVRRS